MARELLWILTQYPLPPPFLPPSLTHYVSLSHPPPTPLTPPLTQYPHIHPVGDMGGSGAAMDPLFWVAHGAVDRLFQKVVTHPLDVIPLLKSTLS